jgi:hypothetical protein
MRWMLNELLFIIVFEEKPSGKIQWAKETRENTKPINSKGQRMCTQTSIAVAIFLTFWKRYKCFLCFTNFRFIFSWNFWIWNKIEFGVHILYPLRIFRLKGSFTKDFFTPQTLQIQVNCKIWFSPKAIFVNDNIWKKIGLCLHIVTNFIF